MTTSSLATDTNVRPAPQFLNLLAGQRLIYTFCHERRSGAVVQLIASTRREGTSTVARDLALIAARMPDMRVLLLDLDMPGNAQMTALREQFGVATLAAEPLTGGPETMSIHRLALGGLHVSEARPAQGAPPPAWAKIFEGLRSSFDLILIDSPSIDRSFDGIMLAPEVDMNLIVLEAERTRSAVAQNLRDRILDAGGPITGVVLNRQRFYIPKWVYRYI